ncbi:hypothetical protein HYC85_024550 [Camellia sinensis]|uniref:Uncharacterized protein n=1 Tax=Camellia sinensis TaxID=4442 RepID=A0A7J7GCB3_CAMSI|nr:hypothetical protein HYC85_024550 [Camellia sinensis]
MAVVKASYSDSKPFKMIKFDPSSFTVTNDERLDISNVKFEGSEEDKTDEDKEDEVAMDQEPVDLECADGRNTLALFSHKRLSVSVGTATAAFALAILEGSTQPGVWFPEESEGIAIEAREALLKRAAQGTINFVMNKPPWMVETDPKELGLGIYL